MSEMKDRMLRGQLYTHIATGASAAVTRDLQPAVVAIGNPARLLREIGEVDLVQIPPRS